MAEVSVSPKNVTFGGYVAVSGSMRRPLESPKTLWVKVECFPDEGGLGLAALEGLPQAGGTATVRIGPTPSWAGGAAGGVATLLVHDGKRGTFRTVARTTFTVEA